MRLDSTDRAHNDSDRLDDWLAMHLPRQSGQWTLLERLSLDGARQAAGIVAGK